MSFPTPNFEVGPSRIQIGGYMMGAFVFQSPKNSYITYDVEEKEKVGTFLINDRKRR